MLDHGPAQARGTIVDSVVLACRIEAYLGATPELELSRHVFYVLANTFSQLFGGRTLSLEVKFWNPSTPLPFEMRDTIALFEQELARCNGHTMTPDSLG